jgi:hypothetical protein
VDKAAIGMNGLRMVDARDVAMLPMRSIAARDTTPTVTTPRADYDQALRKVRI